MLVVVPFRLGLVLVHELLLTLVISTVCKRDGLSLSYRPPITVARPDEPIQPRSAQFYTQIYIAVQHTN